MEMEDWLLLFLLIGVPLTAGLYFKYCLKLEISVVARLTVIISFYLAAIYLFYLAMFGGQMSPEKINKYALLGLIVTLWALGTSHFIELKDDLVFTLLDKDLQTCNQNTRDVMQNSQKILTQINQIEKSQKALTDQIQSLKDSILASKPTQRPKDDSVAGLSSDRE